MWCITDLLVLHWSQSHLISIHEKLLTIQVFTHTHMIYWPCLRKHGLHLHLGCV